MLGTALTQGLYKPFHNRRGLRPTIRQPGGVLLEQQGEAAFAAGCSGTCR